MQPEQENKQMSGPAGELIALSEALLRVKQERNLSLDAFKHDTGYSRSSWNRVLKGQAFPPRDAVARLCARRGLDTAHFMKLWDAADEDRRRSGATPLLSPAGDMSDVGAGPLVSGAVEVDADSAAPVMVAADPAVPVEADLATPVATAMDAAAPGAAAVPPEPVAGPGHATPVTRPDDAADGAAAPADEGRRADSVPVAGVDAVPAPGPSPSEAPVPASAVRDDTSGGRRRPTFDNRWLLLAALVVLLLLGRWYAPTAAGGDAPVAERSAAPQERPYDSEPTASAPVPDETIRPEPDPEGEGDTEREKRFGGVGAEKETPSGPPAARPSQASTSRASGSPSAEASPSAEPEPAKTAAPALGSAGRANCHYSSDRTRTFAKGMAGSEVKEIQCLLNSNYHFTLDIDGKFGTATDTAVRAVQRCSVLTVDGQVGPQTWKYLDTPKSGCGN